jgi:hypothetical protein
VKQVLNWHYLSCRKHKRLMVDNDASSALFVGKYGHSTIKQAQMSTDNYMFFN